MADSPPSPSNPNPRPEKKSSSSKKQAPTEIPTEDRATILELNELGYGTRRIAPRVGHSRKVVQKILVEEGRSPASRQPPTSKLEPFHERIAQKVQLGLTTSRILREIKAEGYSGRRTILAQMVRRLRAQLALSPKPKVKRRFETPPGEEMQIDWSPYRVRIAGVWTIVKAFGCLLCASRKLYLHFFRDESQRSLLEGLALAFEYFGGAAHRLVLDNMATAIVGRIGPDRQVLWNDRFLSFVQHYGTTPFACQVRDPDRKGKKEKSFRLVEDDFLKGAVFSSWDDLHERCRTWLDHTPEAANLRIHGTTRKVPNQAFADERPLLIRLPRERFPVFEETVREVDADSTLSVHGTRYSVPSGLANRTVRVRLYAEHFEVLSPSSSDVVFARRYIDDAGKGVPVIEPTHYANLPRGRRGQASGDRLDDAFVRRFPDLAPLCDGLKRRMKALASVHLRALLRLCDRYGEPAFLAAARVAQDYRRFDALAVERILQHDHPIVEPADVVPPLGGIGPAVLGEVDHPGSLDGYRHLDHDPTRTTAVDSESHSDSEEDSHGP